MDNLSPEHRTKTMRAVRSSNTTPELAVRRVIHKLGFRFRLQKYHLPGSPDVVLSRRGVVVFVNGCFWHRHSCPAGRSCPETNRPYWMDKFNRNVARDRRVRRQLRAMGWRVITVWECQTRPSKLPALERRLDRLLNSS